MGILAERDQLPKNSQAYGKLSYQLRQNQNQLLSEIQSLKAHLERLSDRKRLYVMKFMVTNKCLISMFSSLELPEKKREEAYLLKIYLVSTDKSKKP